MEAKLKLVKDCIKAYPDFPKPGVLFRDIFPILRKPDVLKVLVDLLCERVKEVKPKVDVVAGLDSRGFLFGVPVAMQLGLPFVPIRKAGKLPGSVTSVEFTLEYSKDVVEIQTDSIVAGQSVLLIDDLIATGGSLAAASTLVKKQGATVAECLVVIEISELKGRNKMDSPLHALITY